jgi:hypothetical protein
MNIHEYQAKALLREYGAPVSEGRIVLKADEAKTAAGGLDGLLRRKSTQVVAARVRSKKRMLAKRAVFVLPNRLKKLPIWPSRCWAAHWSRIRLDLLASK